MNAHYVLIVDDDEISIDLLSNVLSSSGYDVLTARNGKEALEKLRESHCRLVVSDLEMPEMDGLELCRRIREGDFSRYIYTILLTSHKGTEDIIAGLSAGADDFVAKPFHPEELTLRVRAGERITAIETRDLAIFAMAKLAESRDTETGAHLERMRNYSQLVAEEMFRQGYPGVEMDPRFSRLIYQTSPLHDIGKIAIPDYVLLKPGRLSDAEFDIMKRHTVIGAQTLEAALREHPTAGFLSMARDIAASHHERYDGEGYPDGLEGDRIPVAARIASLADVYDALTSKRVYKAAFPHEMARAMVVEESGRQFDPRVVDSFLAVEAQFHEVREQFREPSEYSAGSGEREEAVSCDVE